MRLYRVLLHDPDAAPRNPGGVLYAPQNQNGGRIDNDVYRVLYAGDSAAGSCAEVFARGAHRMRWTESMLALRRFPHLQRALAWYDLPDDAPIVNLDDARTLLAYDLRPSDVITRDYTQSQAWSLRIYNERTHCGVQWWSFYDARWKSCGLWNRDVITDFGVEPLTIDHPALAQAATVLDIQLG